MISKRPFRKSRCSAKTGYLLLVTLLLQISAASLTSTNLLHDSSSSPSPISVDQIRGRCRVRCAQQMNLGDDLDIACNATCKISQCNTGCDLWENRSVNCFEECQKVSTSTSITSTTTSTSTTTFTSSPSSQPSIVESQANLIYCAIGCNLAPTIYVEEIRKQIGVPPAPKALPGSITKDALTLQWPKELVHGMPTIRQRIQWKYANISSAWNYFAPAQVYEEGVYSKLNVTNLEPYTTYLYRTEWVVVPWLRISLWSPPSEPIRTVAFGVPTTKCSITSALAISSSQISISWSPPSFANGPIIAYSLSLTDMTTGNRSVKDLQMHSETAQTLNQQSRNGAMNYVFNGLKPETNYTISIVTFNNFGHGPACDRELITLDSDNQEVDSDSSDDEGENVEDNALKLFVASQSEVGRRDPANIMQEEIVYYLRDYQSEHSEISGMAFHAEKQLLFVADSSGTIRSVLFEGRKNHYRQKSRIMAASESMPTHLSIDWLNDRLYFVDDSRILRCELNGENVESVVTGFKQRPIDMKVDPYNGYLFWLLPDSGTNAVALYRVDLNKLSPAPNRRLGYTNAQIIHQTVGMSTFAINYFDYRIYFPKTSGTGMTGIFSVTIDGKDPERIRDDQASSADNEEDSDDLEIKNLIIHSRRLYFTRGPVIHWEEYHEQEKKFYQASFQTESELVSMLIGDRAQSQPTPIPLNPVRNVEAIFLDRNTKISWTPPELYGGAGEGAWQEWKYEVSITEVALDDPVQQQHVATVDRTNCVADDLKPDTEYDIRVRAFSRAGKGAWSDVFRGRTLPELNTHWDRPYALVGSRDGLLKTDIVGKYPDELITRSKLNKLVINDITSLGDHIVVNTDSNAMIYNQHNNSLFELTNIKRASSIAVEPFALKIYWANPNERMICRSNIDGSHMEMLPLMIYANEIALDSINGVLYWSTLHTIEYSRLNGHFQSRKELFRASHEIHSLTVDETSLSWIVLNSDGASVLMRSNLIKFGTEIAPPEKVAVLPDVHLRGPVSRFADRLYWLDTEKHDILVSDDKIKTFATLRDLQNVTAFKLVDPKHKRHDLLFMENHQVQVTPRPVDVDKIHITGTSDNFTLSWPAVTNVNYGDLFYELVVESATTIDRRQLNGSTTSVQFTPSTSQFKPYSSIRVALRPYTYWASAKQVVAELYTPSAIPSAPRDIRVFTYIEQDENIVVEARWRLPANPNGPIQSYSISLWLVDNNKVNSIASQLVNGSALSHRFLDLVPNATYYFEVRASTEAGEGPPSEATQFKTFVDASPPALLVGTQDSIVLADVDLAGNGSEIIARALSPFLLDYHFVSRIVYWIEEGNFLKRTRISSENSEFELLGALPEHATGLTIDWVARRLFIATTGKAPQNDQQNQTKIWTQNIDSPESPLSLLVELNDSQIERNTLRVNPFSSELFWLEKRNSVHRLQSCRLSSYAERCESQRQLFVSKFGSKCNCSVTADLGAVLALDFTVLREPKVVFFDAIARHFVSSDSTGCRCQRLASLPADHEPINLAVDEGWLFWQSLAHGSSVFRTSAVSGKIDRILETSAGTLASFSQRNQPFPFGANSHCLLPKGASATRLRLLSTTATGLTLKIEVPEPGNEVERSISGHCTPSVNRATLHYTVRYKKTNSNQDLVVFESKNSTLVVEDLESFTNYTFGVELHNFYSESSIVAIEPDTFSSPEFVFSTGESRPGPPRNVRAIVESPEKIRVLWNEPLKVNSNFISYEVRWSSSESGHKSVHLSSANRSMSQLDSYFMFLEGVRPGRMYNITVRVLAVDQFTDSEIISVRSFDEPSALRVVDVDSYSVNLTWNSPSTGVITRSQLFMQREQIPSENWTTIVGESSTPHSSYLFQVRSLVPNTRYRFQLSLTYNATKSVYVWPKKYLVVTTKAAVPETPSLHPISKLHDHDGPRIFKVSWDPVPSNSPNPGLFYALYERPFNHDEDLAQLQLSADDRRVFAQNNNWTLVYNGTETYWIVSGLESGRQHLFRLAAHNSVGTSNLSTVSMPFYLPYQDEYEMTAESSEFTLMLIIALCIIFIIFLVLIALISLRRYQNKEKSLSESGSINYPMELRPWQQLPAHPHLLNTLYINSAAENFDLEDVKILDCKDVTKGKLLGKGAFGEVFEGWLSKSEVRVAIKVLNKEESDRVGDFLKEAKLMSQFIHPNILQMLGVCFSQSQQPWLIMEFMEGGDLLNFLRNSRPNKNIPFSKLTMDDMLGICIDIAKGCDYLERKSFVHRDLAARNCLVTTGVEGDELRRTVKIADFGLARGLYRQEYHRKNHIKLPVRWMAPESVVDGVFTSQSDVWSFGIIMYEVMVLGEQPYAGMSNDEVINYIRQGGILAQPTGCPFDIYNLMRRCWAFEKEARPTFGAILRELLEIRKVYRHHKHQQTERGGNRCSQLTTVHNQNYNNLVPGPVYQQQQQQQQQPPYATHLESFSIANNMFAPYQNSAVNPASYHHISHVPDENYLFPTTSSRLTSATIVLDSSSSGESSTSPSTTSSRSSSTNVDRSLYLNTVPLANTLVGLRPCPLYEKNQESSVDIECFPTFALPSQHGNIH